MAESLQAVATIAEMAPGLLTDFDPLMPSTNRIPSTKNSGPRSSKPCRFDPKYVADSVAGIGGGHAVSALGVESPFAKFKTIVALSEADREAAIQELKVSSGHRKVVRAKVSEYASMSETSGIENWMHWSCWHLLPLMKLDATKRFSALPRCQSVFARILTNVSPVGTNWREGRGRSCSRTSRFFATCPVLVEAGNRVSR